MVLRRKRLGMSLQGWNWWNVVLLIVIFVWLIILMVMLRRLRMKIQGKLFNVSFFSILLKRYLIIQLVSSKLSLLLLLLLKL
jgi:hypothetical protein